MDGSTGEVRQNLKLDVTWVLDDFFNKNRVVSKGSPSLHLCNGKFFREHSAVRTDADTSTAPAAGCLDHDRVTDIPAYGHGFRQTVHTILAAWNNGHARIHHDLLCRNFVPGQSQVIGCRPDKGQSGIFAGFGKSGFFGKISVARVNGRGAGLFGGIDNLLYTEIAFSAHGRPDTDGFICQGYVQRVRISF